MGRRLQTRRGGARGGRARAPQTGVTQVPRLKFAPFSSLRAKLIAAFVAVIAISLLMASATFAYLLRQYQIQADEDRLESIAAYNAAQVVRWARPASR